MNFLLCAIAKCENKYILEWVQWHLRLGFNKIVIYDNNDPEGERISDAIGNLAGVEIVDWRGRKQASCETQVAAYNDCYKKHLDADWIFFLDIDEFLEFKEGISLKSFFMNVWTKNANVIKFHWKCYSDSGYIDEQNGLVTETYKELCTDRNTNLNTKSAYRGGLENLKILNVHYCNDVGKIYYQSGTVCKSPCSTTDNNINYDNGWVRHYVTKSLEEFVKIKFARRNPGTSKTRLNSSFYFKYNKRTPEKEQKLKDLIMLYDNNVKVTPDNTPKDKPQNTNWWERMEPVKKPSVYDLQNKKSDKQNTLVNSGENYPFGVSVCISAWKTAEYIEECLDSVANQTWFKDHDNWEILLGIDGCEETLAKVKEIMHKYKNLKVMMMDKNVGTYVTCNTIMKEANYEWLLRFDSDDTMPKDMIAKIFANDLKNIDLIQYKHITTGFAESQGIAFGSHLVKKEIWKKYGGYQSWRICADYDFIFRIETDIKTKKLDNVYYNRFSHNDSLEFSKETDMKSEIRIKYKNYVKNETRKHKIIKLNTTNFYLFYDSTPLILFALPNRGSKNIKYVVDNLKKTYSTYNIKIVIINQFDDVIFKKGQLYNIILKEYDCDFVAMCDNDIIHFNKIKLLSEYYKQNKPFLGFDFISQVKIENEKPIVTSTKANTTGCGAFLFAKKDDFLNIYGYSNLYLGWGCEDNEISCRLCNDNNFTPHVRRIHNTIGHITHPTRNEHNIFERNKNILKTREKRMIEKDGINQTTYDIIKKEIIDDVEYLYVTNIGVSDDFEYKNLL